jgi:hypothetical protein
MAAKPTKTKSIKMLTPMAGADFSYSHGQIVSVAPKIADAWVEAGIAAECESEEAATARADGLEHTVKGLEAENAELRERLAALEAEVAALKAPAAPSA